MLTVAPVGPGHGPPVRSRGYQWAIALYQNQRPEAASPTREAIELARYMILNGAALLAPVPPEPTGPGRAANST